MRSFWLIRGAVVLLVAIAAAWLVSATRWVEIDVFEEPRGIAATDHEYALRRILEAGGATLEVRSALEPLPPRDATLLLNSSFWNIFPGRSERLKAWVENGGHLVVQGRRGATDKDLGWVPISFSWPKPQRTGAPAASSASAPDDVVGRVLPPARGRDDKDDDGDATPARKAQERRDHPFDHPFQRDRIHDLGDCQDFTEVDTEQPAYDPGRVYRGCMMADTMRTVNHAKPAWKLAAADGRTMALRVAYGRGSVTGVPFLGALGNRQVLQSDNGLILSAILQATPGRVVWIVQDEAREALPLWMWHEARTPTLLIFAAVLLSLWRLVLRFGPREAVPPTARRSMGEQVSGTGQFIANADPRALHGATRQAFDAVGRTRIESWADLDDPERVAALAATLAPAVTLDTAALLAALHPAPLANPAQILAAIAVIEQARRALLRAPIAPLAH